MHGAQSEDFKMKKFVSAVLAFFVIFSLTACSGGASGSGAASSASEQELSLIHI